MHALFAFALGPIGRYVVMAGALAALISGAYLKGRWDGASAERASATISAAKATAERLATMGKNDAEIRTMPKADLCRELLASSGLPAGSCD